MICRAFGLPGCGKTTFLTELAYKNRNKYKHIYSNVPLNMPWVEKIEISWLGVYDIRDCLILIDEAMIEFGDRDYKKFSKEKLWFFTQHRHYHADIWIFAQEADGVDKKIRSLSARMYYIYKGKILGHFYSKVVPIRYGLCWPDKKSSTFGNIVMGYSEPGFITRLLAHRVFRFRWYKYFDSFYEDRKLPPLPLSRRGSGDAPKQTSCEALSGSQSGERKRDIV